MYEHVSVHVGAAIAKRLHDQGVVDASRKAAIQAGFDPSVDPATLEPETRRLFTDDELAELDRPDEIWERLRAERNTRLAASDWSQLEDVPEKTRKAWKAYRKQLRGLPTTTKDPAAVKWPQPPK